MARRESTVNWRRGVDCCRNTVAKLMRQAEIRSKARRRLRRPAPPTAASRSTDRRKRFLALESSIRGSSTRCGPPTSPTSPPPRAGVYPGGGARLCMRSRKVIGWADRRPPPHRAALGGGWKWRLTRTADPQGELLHHSDRGVQYAIGEQLSRLAVEARHRTEHEPPWQLLRQRRRREFFSTLKRELILHRESYADHEEVRRSPAFVHIRMLHYNRQRRHSARLPASPSEFENRLK